MSRGSASKRVAQLLSKELGTLFSEVRSINSSAGKGVTSTVEQAVGNGVAQQQARSVSQVAVKTATQAPSLVKVVVPEVKIDLYGAISAVSPGEQVQEGVYKNVDGHRFDDGRYKQFTEEILKFIPKERLYTDAVRTFAYGTDASFYRLNPKMVGGSAGVDGDCVDAGSLCMG